MRHRPERQQRPTIKLHAHTSVRDEQLEQVLLGIEEEDVPCEIARFDECNPLELAHSAATASRLGVGIGIAYDYAVITLDKLPTERPYIAVSFNHDDAHDRITGSNAARLVKRVPLRVAKKGIAQWKH